MFSKHKTTILKIILFFVILLLIVLFIANFVHLNSKYPKQDIQYYNWNEKIKFDNLELAVCNTSQYSRDALIKKFDLHESNILDDNSIYFLVDIYVDINNDEDLNELNLIMQSCSIESEDFANMYSLELVEAVNSLHNTNTQSNEFGKKFVIPFSVPLSLFSPTAWENINNRKFYMAFGIYPTKRLISIN